MNFEESVRKAAKRADHAVQRTMKEYRDGFIKDEDDITGVLVGGLKTELDGMFVFQFLAQLLDSNDWFLLFFVLSKQSQRTAK